MNKWAAHKMAENIPRPGLMARFKAAALDILSNPSMDGPRMSAFIPRMSAFLAQIDAAEKAGLADRSASTEERGHTRGNPGDKAGPV